MMRYTFLLHNFNKKLVKRCGLLIRGTNGYIRPFAPLLMHKHHMAALIRKQDLEIQKNRGVVCQMCGRKQGK